MVGRFLGPRRRVRVSSVADSVLRALFDPTCASCRGPVGPDRVGVVCGACWHSTRLVRPPWCDLCGEPQRSWRHGSVGSHCPRCVERPPHFDTARAFGLYEGSLREMVHAMKYRGHRSLGAALGTLMRSADRSLLATADVVVPVPLHPWRKLRRGFNQAEELARELGRPLWQPLRRRTLGVPQASLNEEERRTNVLTAYGWSWLDGCARTRRPRYVVLVDDVMTTGATMDACSRVLREGGVEWIAALTLARASTSDAAAAIPPLQRPRAPDPSALRR
jgi:ComF family protein